MNDKRKFLRFDTDFNIEFRPSNDAGEEYRTALLKSFSREGLSFASQKFKAEPGDSLELKMKLPDKDIVIPCSGKIIWKEAIGDKVMVGIKFQNIDSAGKGEILEYAYKRWVEREKTKS